MIKYVLCKLYFVLRWFSPGTFNCILQLVMYMLLSNNERKRVSDRKKTRGTYCIRNYIKDITIHCWNGRFDESFWKQFPTKLDLFKYCKTGKFRKTTETFKPQKRRCTFGFAVSMWEYLQPKSYTTDQCRLAEIADTIQFDHCCWRIP